MNIVEKKIVEKLVEECSEDIDGNEMIYNTTLNHYRKVCNSCTIDTALFVTFSITSISISSAHFHFKWYLQRSDTFVSTNTGILIF